MFPVPPRLSPALQPRPMRICLLQAVPRGRCFRNSPFSLRSVPILLPPVGFQLFLLRRRVFYESHPRILLLPSPSRRPMFPFSKLPRRGATCSPLRRVREHMVPTHTAILATSASADSGLSFSSVFAVAVSDVDVTLGAGNFSVLVSVLQRGSRGGEGGGLASKLVWVGSGQPGPGLTFPGASSPALGKGQATQATPAPGLPSPRGPPRSLGVQSPSGQTQTPRRSPGEPRVPVSPRDVLGPRGQGGGDQGQRPPQGQTHRARVLRGLPGRPL